nr:MAG: ORF1 [TTV-like mini virus]
MPWYGYYRQRRWRRRRPWARRFRKAFRRRPYRRRYWVRRKPFYRRKKLKKLFINEYQPKSIRNCKCKGMLCLFQCTENRMSYNFDMYEESFVPQRLPGGGGFSIKNMSLYSLYIEHRMGHNIFTHSNQDYPLMRYKGCKLKLYQSQDVDYICTYSNTWPLISNLHMYNSMQPSIHLQLKNKIIVPSKKTQNRKRPYITKFIPPPTQMKNQWYFQNKLSKVPLFMLRTSACSLDHYYVGNRQLSTNITIYSLNSAVIQNRSFGTETTYWCRQLGTQKYFIYHTTTNTTIVNQIKIAELIILTNTKQYKQGASLLQLGKKTKQEFLTAYDNGDLFGNPFYTDYLTDHESTFIMTTSPTDLRQYINAHGNGDITQLTLGNMGTSVTGEFLPLVKEIRYNPYKDDGTGNIAYFLQSGPTSSHGWDPPGSVDLQNTNLPLWILLYGFPDFVKKSAVIHQVDTNYILAIKSKHVSENVETIIPISDTFYNGTSPYLPISETDKPDPSDMNRWYPQYQYQQEMINTICHSGPGTPKIPPSVTTEAKVKYTFYFKWGGDLPPMSQVEDPTEKPVYPIPDNFTKTTSLQNPETNPAYYLYTFDERRGQLTKTATTRIQKDWESQKHPFLSAGPRFAETTQTQTPQTETSSEEEEEEDLFQLLNKQRTRQLQLKQRILKTLNRLQSLE